MKYVLALLMVVGLVNIGCTEDKVTKYSDTEVQIESPVITKLSDLKKERESLLGQISITENELTRAKDFYLAQVARLDKVIAEAEKLNIKEDTEVK